MYSNKTSTYTINQGGCMILLPVVLKADAYAQLVFSQPDYKCRKGREALAQEVQ
jgi:hypothetical protein